MKETILLDSGWSIRQIGPAQTVDPVTEAAVSDGWLAADTMPAMVHDILLAHGKVPREMLVGWCEGATWTDDFDWLYRCTFPAREGGEAELLFKGLDTFVDVYLNGERLGSYDDFYLSKRIPVGGRLRAENTLLLHFHNAKGVLAALELPKPWQGNMLKCKLLRKPVHDFIPESSGGSNYQGASPWFSPIGIYRDVQLTYVDGPRIEGYDLRAPLRTMDSGEVTLQLSGKGGGGRLTAAMEVTEEDTGRQWRIEGPCQAQGDGWQASLALPLDQPRLWWPRTMGPQSLYRVQAALLRDGKPCDTLTKQVGFRQVENPSSMEFLVNGKRVRLWGGSMDPLQGYTHCWQPERARRLFDMVENANMNTLRIWGEGHPYPDSFYEEADRRGILVWQEFFMGHGSYPNTREFRERVVEEARELVLRLRHHTCLLMWCGGNETVMGAEHDWQEIIGREILTGDFPKLLAELDPGRYYHEGSPSGGEWANDPREGDYHTYNCVLEYPYGDYPNFMSECIRTAPPVLHSLERIIKGDPWPQGYSGHFHHEDIFPFPDNWAQRTHHGAKGHIKTGPYWEFYDARDAREHSYRFAAAYGKDLRRELEHVRMGSRNPNTPPSLRSKGYCSCKLLDTWPKIYCAVIDFFQEGYIPYYATKRGLQPLLLCFDRQDSIRLWLCNDSGEAFRGSVKLGLYHLGSERYLVQESFPVAMGQGEADVVDDLARLKFFPKDTVLCATLLDQDGNHISDSIDYVTEERRLKFPDAKLTVALEGDTMSVTSDRFARSVQLLGECEGDPFGWLFSDNYFDLLPGVPRTVRVVDGPDHGSITLRPQYSPQGITVAYTGRTAK